MTNLKKRVLHQKHNLATLWTKESNAQKCILETLKMEKTPDFTILENYQEYISRVQLFEGGSLHEHGNSLSQTILYRPTSWLEWGEDLCIDISCNGFASPVLLIDNSLAASYIADVTWIMDEKGELEEIAEDCSYMF